MEASPIGSAGGVPSNSSALPLPPDSSDAHCLQTRPTFTSRLVRLLPPDSSDVDLPYENRHFLVYTIYTSKRRRVAIHSARRGSCCRCYERICTITIRVGFIHCVNPFIRSAVTLTPREERRTSLESDVGRVWSQTSDEPGGSERRRVACL